MRSRIPLIVPISEGNMKFDLLIYKDPAILEQSAIDIMARRNHYDGIARLSGVSVLKSPPRGKKKKG